MELGAHDLAFFDDYCMRFGDTLQFVKALAAPGAQASPTAVAPSPVPPTQPSTSQEQSEKVKLSRSRDWRVENEEACYKPKSLETFQLSAPPTDTTMFRLWFGVTAQAFNSIDLTPERVLMAWFRLCDNFVADPREVTNFFHNNTQGMNHLDAWLGQKMISQKWLQNPCFGQQSMHF